MGKRRKVSGDSTWKWGQAVVDILNGLKGRAKFDPAFVDFEVMPPLDGSPDPIAVWFICDTAVSSERFRSSELDRARTKVVSEMKKRGFPNGAAESLVANVTSQESIEKGGGRFAYFR